MELDLSADFALSLGKDVEGIKRNTGPRRFILRPLVKEYVFAADGVANLDFGSPTSGRLWNPVSLAVCGPFTAAKGSWFLSASTRVLFMIGPSDLTGLQFNPMDLRAGLENVSGGIGALSEQFGVDALWCQSSENCYVWVASQAAQTVTVTLVCREYAVDDVFPRNV